MNLQNRTVRTLLSGVLLLPVLLLPLAGAAQTPGKDASSSTAPEKKLSVATTDEKKVEKKDTTAAPRTAAKPWERITFPPLHAFHPQHPKRIEFSNGLVVFLQEDHELPLIDGTIRIRGGSRDEPAGKTGLASVYGHTWRLGGTTSKTGDELDDFLEARAAKVETSSTVDSSLLSWSCLKENFDDVLKIAADVLEHPEFREDKLDLTKKQISTGISRRNDDPESIASREANKLAYGAQSPYARTAEYYTIAAITRADLVDWHNQFVHPNNMILGVVGDFDSTAMEAKLRQAFGDLPRGPEAERDPKVAIDPASPGVYFVEKDDVDQSTIEMVHLGIRRDNPDYYAISVMNEILGGGFSSRLVANCRTKQGLAYGVGGGVGAFYGHVGTFRVSMGTKSSTTGAGIDCLYGQLDDLEKKPVTEAELKRAKDTILNSFIFQFDDKDKVLQEQMVYEYFGYPADFLERFPANIKKVTVDDVERVALKYIHKDQLKMLVVGNSKDFDRDLSTFGKVNKIDITIPEAPPSAVSASAKPAATNPEGKALIAKVATALGDKKKLRAVKSIRQTITSVRKTPQGDISLDIDQTIVYPDQVYVKAKTSMGEMTTVITPQKASMDMGGQHRDMPSAMRDENLKVIRRDPIYILQHAGDSKYTFTASGDDTIEGVQTKILAINADGIEVKWYVDPSSGHLLRAAFHTQTMQGPAERVVDYSDWRDASGLSLPYKRTVTENGATSSEDTIKSIELNPVVDPKLFTP
ncbi:MAG TPA: pitrilysin family protein [Terriglobales bacterium]|jgi:zinc protease|nr:pitrilysin family protein [Terriglobales bacterium]